MLSWTPLLTAAYYGHVACIETLVVFGANIDDMNEYDENAIMWASVGERVSVSRLLLSLNVDLTKIDRTGKTVLQSTKSEEIKQLLLDHEKKLVTNEKCFYLLFKKKKERKK